MKTQGEIEGAVCEAKYSERRLFCPRGIYPFWREIWLKRVGPANSAQQNKTSSEKVEVQK